MKKSNSLYGKWTRIVENVPDTVRVKQGFGQKVVLEPKDERTLDIKVVNDADVLTVDQKLTPSGFKAIIDFIKGIPSIIGYYPALSDLVKNVVVYTVSKDTDRTQKITFIIGSKVELGGIDSSIEYLRQDEIEQAKAGTLLNTSKATATSTASFTVPVASSKIKDSTDAKLITWMKETWKKIDKDPIAGASPIMAEVKKEINAAKLGTNSQTFIAGLNAGYGIYDWSGKDVETGITQKLIDKVALTAAIPESRVYLHPFGHRLVEAVSEQVSGFDPEAFVAEVNRISSVSTGDIVVPPGGFKKGITNDAELKKFQNLLLTNYAAWTGVPEYDSFKKAGTMQGNYGPKTEALVSLLKAALTEPKWNWDGSLSDEGNVIEPEFVKRIQEEGVVTESRGYLSLSGSYLITEKVSLAQARKTIPVPVVAKPAAKKKSGGGVKSSGGRIRTTTAAPGYEYAANPVKGIWTTREVGETSADWRPSVNWSAIKDLMERYPNDGAYYTIPPAGDRGGLAGRENIIYKPSSAGWLGAGLGETPTKLAGSTSITWLDKHYGKAADLAAGKTTPTPVVTTPKTSGATTAEIDKALTDLGYEIEAFIEDSDRFEAYKSYNPFYGGDDEDAAWKNIVKPEYEGNWSGRIDAISNKVRTSTNIKESDKKRYRTSIDTLRDMFRIEEIAYTGANSFYQVFQGNASFDDFDLILMLSGSNVKKINIQTDF